MSGAVKKNIFPWILGGLVACVLLGLGAFLALRLLTGNGGKTFSPRLPPKFAGSSATPDLQSTPELAVSATETPAVDSAAALALTPTLPSALDLTHDPQGGYDHPNLLFDSSGVLHLVYYSLKPRTGDYFHQQLPPGGAWSSPETLTADFDYLWSDLELKLHPQGYVCVLWGGVTASGEEAYFKRCQDGSGGSFSPAEAWLGHVFDTRAGFAPLLQADGSVLAAFDRVGGGISVGEQYLTDELAPDHSSQLVQDAAGGYHLVWFRQGEPYSLLYSTSTDGAAWSEIQPLTTDTNAPDAWYDLEADSRGSLHLVWPGFSSGLYYRRWTAGGGWSDAVQIGPRNCIPKVAANAQGLARVAIGCWDGVFLLQQKPDGSWLVPSQVSTAGGALDIAVDGQDTAHIVYLADGELHYATVAVGAAMP